MKQYKKMLIDVKKLGTSRPDRTGIGRRSIFGYQMRFDLEKGFPLVTTKKIHWKSVVHELLWFISGSTNIKYLTDNGVKIWNEWADSTGELGPVYGHQWRHWEGSDGKSYDQLRTVIDEIKRNPNSSRLIVNAWNVADVPSMALPPCHTMFQFFVSGNNLSLQLYQRSADVFLGVPFNIASYALLLVLVANECGLTPKEFIWTGGDVHIYENHREQVSEQLRRKVKKLPKLVLNVPKNTRVEDIKYEDIELVGYKSHPPIKGKVAV
jgi:thymidylate synthase